MRDQLIKSIHDSNRGILASKDGCGVRWNGTSFIVLGTIVDKLALPFENKRSLQGEMLFITPVDNLSMDMIANAIIYLFNNIKEI